MDVNPYLRVHSSTQIIDKHHHTIRWDQSEARLHSHQSRHNIMECKTFNCQITNLKPLGHSQTDRNGQGLQNAVRATQHNRAW